MTSLLASPFIQSSALNQLQIDVVCSPYQINELKTPHFDTCPLEANVVEANHIQLTKKTEQN